MSKRVAKPIFSIEALEGELERRGIGIALNVISNDIVFEGIENDKRIRPETEKNSLPTVLFSDMRQTHSYLTSSAMVERFLLVIASQHPVNPVWDYIACEEWDGHDHYNDMLNAMGDVKDDELSRILIRKWFRMGLSLLKNSLKAPFGGDGCLTLCGRQGLGKTRWAAWAGMSEINPSWFRSGQRLNRFDKDNARRILTCFVAELGELDSTIANADNGAIKSFISESCDEYRLPYARTDERIPRHTSLVASVNDSRFITDQTGARRFWTVPVRRFDLDALFNIPAVQVWRQVLHEDDVLHNLQSFRLTEGERARLEMRNSDHTQEIDGESVVRDLFERDDIEFLELTMTEWIERNPSLRGLSSKKLGAVLNKMDIPRDRRRRALLPVPIR